MAVSTVVICLRCGAIRGKCSHTRGLQLTVTGKAEPMVEPEQSGKHEQDHLFTAPQLQRGQMNLETEE